jgi:Mg2+ and Co2+ transporter CorA
VANYDEKQLLWENVRRGPPSEQEYVIRDFDIPIANTGEFLAATSSQRKSWSECLLCQRGYHYATASEALDHLHMEHFHCDASTDRPFDDPCLVWLRRIWPSGRHPPALGNSIWGVVEDFIAELQLINTYTREIHSLVTNGLDNTQQARPPLPVPLGYAFSNIVALYIIRARTLSVFQRRIPNMPRDMDNRLLNSLRALMIQGDYMTNDVTNQLRKAKKDIIMKKTSHQIDSLDLRAVGIEFLVMTLMVNLQNRPMLANPWFTDPHKPDYIQLYGNYSSQLRFQANRRPQKRVFLDIHTLGEELDALEGTITAQRTLLNNYLKLISPGSTTSTNTTRVYLYGLEKEYGESQDVALVSRENDIEMLKSKSNALKEQVKQTLEILEEDHGKAIRVFTIVTLLFLPLSFVSSFMGMNTTDVRDTEFDQRVFWWTGIPVTVVVVALAMLYAYHGEGIASWFVDLFQRKRRRKLRSTGVWHNPAHNRWLAEQQGAEVNKPADEDEKAVFGIQSNVLAANGMAHSPGRHRSSTQGTVRALVGDATKRWPSKISRPSRSRSRKSQKSESGLQTRPTVDSLDP